MKKITLTWCQLMAGTPHQQAIAMTAALAWTFGPAFIIIFILVGMECNKLHDYKQEMERKKFQVKTWNSENTEYNNRLKLARAQGEISQKFYLENLKL